MALYDEVVEVAKVYMGPAAKKFIDRQIKGHLDINEAELDTEFLDELAKWCYTSSKLMMKEQKARELSEKILSLK